MRKTAQTIEDMKGIIKEAIAVSRTGIDYSLAVPCSNKKNCTFCKHLDKLGSENKDPKGKIKDKDSSDMFALVKARHKKGIYIKKGEDA